MNLDGTKTLTALRKHQLQAVKALENVDEICKKHNIKYFLIAGTTLGAIRHKGFIPWDDDIDIGMCMDDYVKFKENVVSSLEHQFTWQDTDIDKKFPTLTGRISYNGNSLITVFPIIKLSDNLFQRRTQWIIRKVMSPIFQRKVRYKIPEAKDSFSKMVIYAISSFLAIFFTRESALKIIRWNEMRYEHKNTEYFINLYSKYSMAKESIRAEWIDKIKYVPFEGKMYPIFHDYDEYLTHLYGNYMELLPVSQRRPEHTDFS